jgi:hypothetical protein
MLTALPPPPRLPLPRRAALAPPEAAPAPGLPAGTAVATLDGLLPVEWLAPGDRVVARSGLVALVAVAGSAHAGPLVRLPPGALGPGRPARACLLHPDQRLRLTDGCRPRAADLLGRAGVAAVRLPAPARLIRLGFARPEIVRVAGLDLICDGAPGGPG